MGRKAVIKRKTAETDISMTLELDGTGKAQVKTGVGFLDHMFTGFAKHGYFDLDLKAVGDLEVDAHHTVEDCGIVLGNAIAKAVGDKKGISRFGYFILPMDEALVLCSIDLCGRPYFSMDASFKGAFAGDMDTQLVREFFYAVSYSAGMNLHFKMLSGENDHHIIEAMFKAFGKALDMATSMEPRCTDVPSTKGSLA
ncbi:MAG: imidazoleglycerol-phosphate dehydratase HisB [Lachnospiraceae bacterium]|nr:imidazoleglycerol-phosphate dehydratase HisB [Lachnospiraceae bacterium]